MKHQIELENEQWVSIEGYEDYEVSNFGRVKSLNYNRTNQEQMLKPINTKKGYQQISLYKDGKQTHFLVHRLVAMAFIDNPNNYPVVNHKDENPSNNHVENLEWCTVEYNNNYGTARERHSKTISGEKCYLFGKFGKEHPNSKQIIQLTLDGEVIKSWDSAMDVERELSFYHGNISACCRNKRKSANGYKWCYA